MTICVLDRRLEALIAPDARFELLVEGLATGEGPVWMASERRLVFTDVGIAPTEGAWIKRHAGRLLGWSERGVETLLDPSGKMVGLARDAGDRLICCQSADGLIVRLDHDGRAEVLASDWQGHRFSNPNDVVVRSDGAIYFTDSGAKPASRPFHGVYRIPPGGGEARLVARDFTLVNGLAFTPDEQRLYVNDSHGVAACPNFFYGTGTIRVYDVLADGSLARSRLFAELRGPAPGVPDGMKVDAQGNVYCTGPGGIWVFDDRGEQLGVIGTQVGGTHYEATNLAWGGEDGRTLFVTTSTALIAIPTRVRGMASSR